MKAAIVHAQGLAPAFGDFDEPEPAATEHLIAVDASAISPLTRGRASGAHYSASSRYPFVAGVDGVGRTEEGGERVYFLLPRGPFGAMAERTVAAKAHCVPVPEDIDDVTAAAIANPGMSSFAALTERARFKAGETVLVNGGTGASGQLAVRIARQMGASRVIATGRDHVALDALKALGADETIVLGDDDAALDARFCNVIEAVDVVLDYLWGDSASRLLAAAAKVFPEGKALRFVQIGNSAGAQIPLPGAVLRSAAIELLGSGLGSVPLPRLLAAIAGTFAIAAGGGLDLPLRVMPLREVSAAWTMPARERVVLSAR